MNRKKIKDFLSKNKNFVLVWVSQILSLVTIHIINFLMMSKIYERTGSSLAVSFLWVFYYVPAFFLGPFSGIFVDHWKKRNILLYTNLLQSLSILIFLFIGEKIYLIYPFVFLYSMIDEFYLPAQAASIPLLVRKADLTLANSLFLITSQGSLVVGFGLGGILMRILGENSLIVLCSFFLFAAAVSVSFLPSNEPQGARPINNISRFWGELKAGYLYILGHRIILFPLILAVFFNVLLSSFGVSLPALASQLVNVEVKDAGPLMVIPLGLGALFGIGTISRLVRKTRKKNLIKTGFLLAFVVFIILSIFLNLSGRFKHPLVVILCFLLGIGGIFIFIPNQTLLQENIPPKLRGRIFGASGFASNVLTLPFILFTATIIDVAGIRQFILLSTLFLFVFLVFFRKAEESVNLERIAINGDK